MAVASSAAFVGLMAAFDDLIGETPFARVKGRAGNQVRAAPCGQFDALAPAPRLDGLVVALQQDAGDLPAAPDGRPRRGSRCELP